MKKRTKIILLIVAAILLLSVAGIFLYASDYYRASPAAEALLQSPNVRVDGNAVIVSPASPTDTGLIFYPGGKVEHTAYLPLLQKLAQRGILCVLISMPLRLAVLDVSAADSVYAKVPEIKKWYIGGHSLGGAMASSYFAGHKNQINGLILLGAYLYGDVPPSRALTLYGSEDRVLDRSKITYTENVLVLSGGNHAGFGSYGPQAGDGTAAITETVQQEQAADAILSFLRTHP